MPSSSRRRFFSGRKKRFSLKTRMLSPRACPGNSAQGFFQRQKYCFAETKHEVGTRPGIPLIRRIDVVKCGPDPPLTRAGGQDDGSYKTCELHVVQFYICVSQNGGMDIYTPHRFFWQASKPTTKSCSYMNPTR